MNVPRLRFKEFKDDWQLKTIGTLGVFRGGGTPNTQNPAYWSGDIPWVSSSDLGDENIYDINISRKITQEAVSNSATKVIPANSILIVSRVGVGKVAVSPSEICTSQDFSNLTLNSGDNVFFAYLIKNKTKNLLEFNQGTSIKGFVKSDLESYVIQHPSYEEQQKIASFLSSVDQKISLLRKRHELLVQYKKGVMRKIFSQEIRFKDMGNKDFPGWVEHTLGDICEPRQHKTISGTHLLPNGYPVFGANGLIGYYDSYNHELETVAVTCRGATCGEVTLVPAKSWITGNSMSLDNVNTKENNHKFIYYAVINRGFKDVISGSAQPQIVGSAIRSVKLTMPKIEEQEKIAKFLSSIDDRISLAQSQITLTKKYKQGLLQQMFI